MKSFHKFLGIAALAFFVLLIGSSILLGTYVARNNVSFAIGDNHNYNWNWPWNSGEKSSRYETLTTTDEKTFAEIPENFTINVSLDDIIFIEEDREDVFVEYYSERPDSSLYKESYDIEMIDDTLHITTTTTVHDLFLDVDYDSYIKIHVPKDAAFDTLDLSLSLGEIDSDSILNNVKNLYVVASLGDVNLAINSPKEKLSISCELGTLDLDVTAPVGVFEASADLGAVHLNISDTVESLWCTSDLGEVTINADANIKYVNLDASMGGFTGTFKGHIDEMLAKCDMGSINLTLYENEGTTTYADTDMGSIDIDSSLKITKERDNPNFKLYSSMGSITVKVK